MMINWFILFSTKREICSIPILDGWQSFSMVPSNASTNTRRLHKDGGEVRYFLKNQIICNVNRFMLRRSNLIKNDRSYDGSEETSIQSGMGVTVSSGGSPGLDHPISLQIIRGLTVMSFSTRIWHARRTSPSRLVSINFSCSAREMTDGSPSMTSIRQVVHRA